MSINVDDVEYSTRAAIGELLLRADSNPLVKRVLTVIDPFASKSAMVKSLSTFRLDMLEACAEFLEIPLADSEDNKIYTKESLQSRIFLAVKALLPSTCSECSSHYMIQHDAEEKPLSYCYMCFQGAHDCEGMKAKVDALKGTNSALPAGYVWLCHSCLAKSNPVVLRKTKSRHNSVSSLLPPTAPNSRAPSPLPEQESQSESQPRRENHHTAEDICDRYKKGKCPHGLRGNKLINGHKCSLSHPKRCFKFCGNGDKGTHGCKKGDNCQFYHPVLCKFSLRKRICTNEQCTFVHLKGTKRKAQPQPLDANTNLQGNSNPQQRSTGNQSRNETENDGTVEPQVTADHFLQLKNIMELMSNNIRNQQQEISSLRSSMFQFHQFHTPHFQASPNQPTLIQNHLPVQQPYRQGIHPAPMTFIFQSSC